MDRRVALWGAVLAAVVIFLPWAMLCGLIAVVVIYGIDVGPFLSSHLEAIFRSALFLLCASFTTTLLGALLAAWAATARGGGGCVAILIAMPLAGATVLFGAMLLSIAQITV